MKGTTTVLTAPDEVELREYDVVDPEPGGLLLRMIRANVCGSEVHIVHGRHPLIQAGCVMGHEGVGRVERIGAGPGRDSAGDQLHEGDRVVATYWAWSAASSPGTTPCCLAAPLPRRSPPATRW